MKTLMAAGSDSFAEFDVGEVVDVSAKDVVPPMNTLHMKAR
ncbi:hypothetical protein [Azospirillum sp.]